MASKNKINVKERFSDGEIDLSMSDLDDVPVKEIATLRKTTSLDLSNNRLTKLPGNFTTLVNLTKLDLSRNELRDLPEDFGNLSRLKHLDLYRNQLERLPLSFGELKDLRFLDLKDNPLVPTITQVAGPCVDHKDCVQCARDIVAFYRKLQEQVEDEVEMRRKARQKQLDQDQHQKQEDKKNKAKQKQKEKPKPAINEPKKIPIVKKAAKKNKKFAGTSKKCSGVWCFLKTLAIVHLLAATAVFVSTSVNYQPTKWLVPLCSDYYNAFLNKLPPGYRLYGEQLANFTSQVHLKTGETVLNLAYRVSSSEILGKISDKIKEIYNNFVNK